MRKFLVSLLAFSLLVATPNISTGALKSKALKVTIAFQNLLSTSDDGLSALEGEYESQIDILDAALAAATATADLQLQTDLAAASSLYTPQINSSNKKVEDAKIFFSTVNQVKLSTGFFAISAFGDLSRLNGYLDCPDTTLPGGPTWLEIAKRNCADYGKFPRPGDMSKKGNPGSTVGGEDWQKGDIATINFSVADNRDVQNGIAAGFITPLNQIGFDSTRLTISSETLNAALLIQKYGSVRISAQSKYEALIASATKKRQSGLDELTSRYEDAKAKLEAQADAAETALLAAKRASKDPTNFDKAFSVAYKFEYNRVILNEIANLPWTGNWSFRTINSLIKVTNLADLGDSIASRYSYKAATSFNLRVGTAFTNEPDFRAVLKIVSTIYKKTTNTSLKV